MLKITNIRQSAAKPERESSTTKWIINSSYMDTKKNRIIWKQNLIKNLEIC